ncbi:restriction endonuclease [Pseudomonas sp. FR229a]|uniref:nSTAND3 domain-containing NTPase n=1 Tax=Pseudomonas sp. FR229a TaxID=3040313 RepID=UPI002552E024|nr:restriction endonuclease [Pseudomonas sp. FR229a]
MSDYDFSRLNDKEFEIFCTDLLSAREGVKFERFKPGRDAGVDGRFFKPGGEEWILQCKHWISTPLEKLVKSIADSESLKVQKLSPSRYILALSHPLSRNDKNILMQKLSPFVLSSADILGREDLSDILAKHPDVERRHYKLWIASSNVLAYMLNKPIYDRSHFELGEIIEDSKRYVATANHLQAIEKLESTSVVIITGPAGIGKTTLAGQLILHYVADGFELSVISDDVREAEGVYDPDSKQIFYFDDFLGRNYLEALSGHECAKIVGFIKRIVKTPKKRFVLTSRTTILNQGKILDDVFHNSNVSRNEFEITLESLAQIDKAQILYNHIWHSEMDGEYVEQLYSHRRYRTIIEHKNFNPRLIRFITDAQRLENVTSETYWSHITDLLNDPSLVWGHPFEAQLDDCGRALVLLVAMNGRLITEPDLSEAFSRYLEYPGAAGLTGRKDFLLNFRHLSGSMLTRFVIGENHPFVRLFNPSLGDFVLNRYANNTAILRQCFGSLKTLSSLKTLKDMTDNKIINTKVATEVIEHVFASAVDINFLGTSAEFVAQLCIAQSELGKKINLSSRSLSKAIDFIGGEKCGTSFMASAQVLLWALRNGGIDKRIAEAFLLGAFSNDPNYDELLILGQLVKCFDIEVNQNLYGAYDQAITEYLIASVEDEFPQAEVFSDGGSQTTARAKFIELMDDKASELGANDSSGVADSVASIVDVDRFYDKYFYETDHEPSYQPYRERMNWSERSFIAIDPIDDLFSRD